ELAREIGVAQQQRARRGGAFGSRQGLSLATTRQPQDDGARFFGNVGGAVARTIVRDDHLRLRKRPAQPQDRRPDHSLLVPSRDEDSQRLIHPPGQAAGRWAATALVRFSWFR